MTKHTDFSLFITYFSLHLFFLLLSLPTGDSKQKCLFYCISFHIIPFLQKNISVFHSDDSTPPPARITFRHRKQSLTGQKKRFSFLSENVILSENTFKTGRLVLRQCTVTSFVTFITPSAGITTRRSSANSC